MDDEELRFFLQGATSLDLVEPNPTNTGRGWLTDKSWGDVIAVSNIASMSGFADNFKSHLDAWEAVFVSEDPLTAIQGATGDDYQPFQKLLLLRAVRPDTVVPGVQEFVAKVKRCFGVDTNREELCRHHL